MLSVSSKIWEKVEYVRQQPEHVRMRYVMGCLLVSMMFIAGIWMLSLRESFTTASDDLTLPEGGESILGNKPEIPSLETLLEESAPLQVENTTSPMTGGEYFNEQYQASQAAPSQTAPEGTLQGEGINANPR